MSRKSKRTATRKRPDGGESRPSTKAPAPAPEPSPPELPAAAAVAAPASPPPRSLAWTILAVVGLLVLHYVLAARSLLRENPTVDEVAHLPAGVTYWQMGTFRLYPHNPPLFKLVAALPVVMARPVTEPLFPSKSWRSKFPSPASFSQFFAYFNADRYFELFQLARLMMPLFTVIGGGARSSSRLIWPSRVGEPVDLAALWAFCANILARSNSIYSDASSTAVGVAATYVFWRYLSRPTWRWAVAAGVLLGIALSSSTLGLLPVRPLAVLLAGPADDRGTAFRERIAARRAPLRYVARSLVQGIAIVALSILTIDAGYFFEGVGIPLGKYEFGSRTLTRPVPPGMSRPTSQNPLFAIACGSGSSVPGYLARSPADTVANIISWASTSRRSSRKGSHPASPWRSCRPRRTCGPGRSTSSGGRREPIAT